MMSYELNEVRIGSKHQIKKRGSFTTSMMGKTNQVLK